MKTIVCLCLLLIIQSASARRLPYTSEIISSADLVGIWTAKEVEEGKLKAPAMVMKGDPALAPMLKGKELGPVLERLEKGERLILTIFEIGGKVSIAKNHGVFTASDENIQMIKSIINQRAAKRDWAKMPIEQQVESSSIIVRGKIKDRGTLPRFQSIQVQAIFKGEKVDSLSIYPVAGIELMGESADCLFLVQKRLGTGPAYQVMRMIPWGKSQEYLAHVKAIKH